MRHLPLFRLAIHLFILSLVFLAGWCVGYSYARAEPAPAVTVVNSQVMVHGVPVIGLQDCLSSIAADGGLGFDGECRRPVGDCQTEPLGPERFAPLPVYSHAYRAVGFNTWRVGRGGACSPSDPGVLIPILAQLKNDGWAIWFTLYSEGDPILQLEPSSAAYATAGLVGVYSPYVDIWEVGGEIEPTHAWLAAVVQAIRSSDPQHRLVSHSWNEPAYADIVDINSPHFYTADPDVSGAMHAAINAEWQKMPGKPLVFGETGNAVQNWSHASVQRIHDFITTALQNNVGIIFWNTSNAKDYLSESANVYLGPAERAEVARITAGLGPIATPTPTPRTINQPKAQPRRPPCWLKGCP